MASLIACAAALHRIRERITGPWNAVLAWIDSQLNRLWQARGAFPGLRSALSALGFECGFQDGRLLAYEIELLREREQHRSAWQLVDEIMSDPRRISEPIAQLITPRMRQGWQHISSEQKALLELLARCALSEDQARRIYDTRQRTAAGISATIADLLANPYQLYELDRCSLDPINFAAVDRGMFPDEQIRRDFPLPVPSRLDDPADVRRVRALVIDLLESAAQQGHTLLPRSWVIDRARERPLQPPCPLGENVLAATVAHFAPLINEVLTRSGEPAYQVDRLVQCRQIINREVTGRPRPSIPRTGVNSGVDDAIACGQEARAPGVNSGVLGCAAEAVPACGTHH